MLYILILLLVPIFFVGMVIYVCTIFDFMVNNNFDTVLLLIGLFASIISGFFALKEFSLIEIKSCSIIKFQKRVNSIIGLFSYSLVCLFGVSLVVNVIIHDFNVAKLLIGIAFILFYIYVIYYYFVSKKIYVCTISEITKISDNVYLIKLNNKDIGDNEYYVKDKKGLKQDKLYKVYYSNANKCVTNILDEVIEG